MNLTRNTAPSIFGAILLVGTVSFSQNQATAPASSDSHVMASDRTFMDKAAQGGMAEIELGHLAEQNAQSADVKDFGKHMVDDHSKAGDQLEQIASQNGVTPLTEVSAKDNATKQRLSQLHSEAFDNAYMKDMVRVQRQDVAEFKHESSAGHAPR
jgi:putative membrane protein